MMKLITEYLSSKIGNKTAVKKDASVSDLFNALIDYFFRGEDKNTKEDLKLACMNAFENHKNDNEEFRIFGDSKLTNENLRNLQEFYNVHLFDSLIDNDDYLYEDICNGIVEGKTTMDYESFGDSDIAVWHNDYAVCLETGDFVIVVERLEKNAEINPQIDSYHNRGKSYIELSSRQIICEIDNVPDDDRFWSNYNMFCEDRIKEFNTKFPDIELELLGRNGKHVCALATLELVHKYDEVVKEIKRLQDNLLIDAKDEAEYWNDENS